MLINYLEVLGQARCDATTLVAGLVASCSPIHRQLRLWQPMAQRLASMPVAETGHQLPMSAVQAACPTTPTSPAAGMPTGLLGMCNDALLPMSDHDPRRQNLAPVTRRLYSIR